jgi:DNA-binding response OmpR family regulator
MRARILLLEDDPRIRAAMRMALEHEGQKVHEAASGEQALRDFAGEPFDIALIDLMLPGIDGFEVCRTLRRVSDIPIIMVTARTDSHDVVAGLEAGADVYVSKPFMAKELSARIRALLRRARGQGTTRPRSTFGERVLSREELLESVWDYDYFGDGRLVDVQVRRLRTKIEPDPADPRHIVTVRGMGYKLVP